ncbi:MAG: 2-dehydropantoate 2-reductase [Planctomycetota bacterium]|nr:2-dehydropantoate 2-reductase [Planctomycetota bacterium]
MSTGKPVIAVIGAGAVGSYYGARLAQHEHDVHFHMRSDWQIARKHGLRIKSPDGDFALPANTVNAYGDTTSMPRADLVIVTLKTTANDLLGPLIAPVLNENTAILTLQNGLGNEQVLAELFGAERILGGMAFVCINRIAPGEIHHLDHGLITIAELCVSPDDRVEGIAALFSSSKIRCRVLPDLMTGRWEKLIWNVPFNGLGALLDQTTDRLIHSPQGLMLVRQLMEEVIAAARGFGIEFGESVIEEKIEHTRSMGPYMTSMQVDRRNHRPMEIETIIGEPLRAARRKNIVTPRLQMLYDLLNHTEIDSFRE